MKYAEALSRGPGSQLSNKAVLTPGIFNLQPDVGRAGGGPKLMSKDGTKKEPRQDSGLLLEAQGT